MLIDMRDLPLRVRAPDAGEGSVGDSTTIAMARHRVMDAWLANDAVELAHAIGGAESILGDDNQGIARLRSGIAPLAEDFRKQQRLAREGEQRAQVSAHLKTTLERVAGRVAASGDPARRTMLAKQVVDLIESHRASGLLDTAAAETLMAGYDAALSHAQANRFSREHPAAARALLPDLSLFPRLSDDAREAFVSAAVARSAARASASSRRESDYRAVDGVLRSADRASSARQTSWPPLNALAQASDSGSAVKLASFSPQASTKSLDAPDDDLSATSLGELRAAFERRQKDLSSEKAAALDQAIAAIEEALPQLTFEDRRQLESVLKRKKVDVAALPLVLAPVAAEFAVTYGLPLAVAALAAIDIIRRGGDIPLERRDTVPDFSLRPPPDSDLRPSAKDDGMLPGTQTEVPWPKPLITVPVTPPKGEPDQLPPPPIGADGRPVPIRPQTSIADAIGAFINEYASALEKVDNRASPQNVADLKTFARTCTGYAKLAYPGLNIEHVAGSSKEGVGEYLPERNTVFKNGKSGFGRADLELQSADKRIAAFNQATTRLSGRLSSREQLALDNLIRYGQLIIVAFGKRRRGEEDKDVEKRMMDACKEGLEKAYGKPEVQMDSPE